MADRKLRKDQITEQREEQILKAALKVFTQQGYAAATIPEIAGEAGVAVGTIYNYYAGKRELFIAVMKTLIFTGPFLELKVNMLKSNITSGFKQIIQDRLNLMETEPGSHIPFLMSEILRDPEIKSLWVEEFIQPLFTQIETVYCDIVTSGGLRHIEPSVASRALCGMIIGFNMLRFLEGDKSPIKQLSQEELSCILADFILFGLTPSIRDNDS
jgi:AcrR family transcriptional regulator